MVRVPPEIVQQPAAPGDVGDVVRPVEDRLQRVAIGLVRGVAVTREGLLALRRGPRERTRAVDVLEPEIRVVVGRLERRARIDIGHRQVSVVGAFSVASGSIGTSVRSLSSNTLTLPASMP